MAKKEEAAKVEQPAAVKDDGKNEVTTTQVAAAKANAEAAPAATQAVEAKNAEVEPAATKAVEAKADIKGESTSVKPVSAGDLLMKDPEPTSDPKVVRPADGSVKVLKVRKADAWPFKKIMAAGIHFTAEAQEIRSDHPAMDEFVTNPYLVIEE